MKKKGRLFCCRKVVVKKGWRLLYFCCLTMQQMCSSLPAFPYHDFRQQDSLFSFHPLLVSVLFIGPSLLVVHFYRKSFTLVKTKLASYTTVHVHVAMSFQLVVYANITTVYAALRLMSLLPSSRRKGT